MTIHPLVYVAARQPQLIVAHLKAYGDLLLEEGRRTVSSLLVHAALYAAAGVLAMLGLLFGGVSLLLWAAIAGELRHGWLLIVLPVGSLLVSAICVLVARLLSCERTLGRLGHEVRVDINMIHEAGNT